MNIKAFILCLVCWLLCACTAETVDNTIVATSTPNTNGAYRLRYWYAESPEEIDSLMAIIEGKEESNELTKREDNGGITHRADVSYCSYDEALKVKKSLECGGYPRFDKGKMPGYYYLDMEYLFDDSGYAQGWSTVYHYGDGDMYDALYRIQIISTKKAALSNLTADTGQYKGEINFDGHNVKMYESDEGHLFGDFQLNNEYVVFLNVTSNGENKKLDIKDINFDGVHLFK